MQVSKESFRRKYLGLILKECVLRFTFPFFEGGGGRQSGIFLFLFLQL